MVAVGGVGGGDGVYEDPDKLARSIGRGNYELTHCPAYVSGQSTAPVYAADYETPRPEKQRMLPSQDDGQYEI